MEMSLNESISYLNVTSTLSSESPLCLLFYKNNQLEIINMPKRPFRMVRFAPRPLLCDQEDPVEVHCGGKFRSVDSATASEVPGPCEDGSALHKQPKGDEVRKF